MNLAGIAASGLGAPQEVPFVNQIALDKPLYGVLFEIRYRLTVTAALGALHVEGPINLVQRIRVTGSHKRYGDRELVNMRAATLAMVAQKYQGFALEASPAGIGGSVLFGAEGAAVGIATYDFCQQLPVYFVPPGINPAQEALFLVRNDEWKNFNIYITFGDASAIAVIAGGQACVFTDYGVATGTPRVRISPIKTILGPARNLIVPALYRQSFLPLTTILTAAPLTDAPIQDLTTGFKVHSYLCKIGAQDLATTAGVFAFTGLLDTAITRPKVKLDTSTTLRDFISCAQARAWSKRQNNENMRVGYIPIDFCEQHNINTVFRGDRLTMQNKLQLAGDITSAAGQAGEVNEFLIEGDPRVLKAAS